MSSSSSSSSPYRFRYNPKFHPTGYVWRPVQKPQPQPQPQPEQQEQEQEQEEEHEQEEELDLTNLMSYVVEMQSIELLQAAVMQRKAATAHATPKPNVVAASSVGEIIPRHHRLRQMVSFLEKDDSFLTPWGWDSFAHQSGTATFSFRPDNNNKYHRFQLGSFFYRQYPEYFLRRRHR